MGNLRKEKLFAFNPEVIPKEYHSQTAEVKD